MPAHIYDPGGGFAAGVKGFANVEAEILKAGACQIIRGTGLGM